MMKFMQNILAKQNKIGIGLCVSRHKKKEAENNVLSLFNVNFKINKIKNNRK